MHFPARMIHTAQVKPTKLNYGSALRSRGHVKTRYGVSHSRRLCTCACVVMGSCPMRHIVSVVN